MGVSRVGKIPALPSGQALDKRVEDVLHKVGRVGVEYAIQNHEFNNQTNNLEDSYGYAIYKDGSLRGVPFVTTPKAKEPNDGKYGSNEAYSFFASYKPSSNEWVLVVVAGMEYASMVQFYYGLDVLQGSELEARKEIYKRLNNIKWESR